ncbi:hypothetical protein LTR27_003260 [Elasticomyces elasticus]|nr:hypothetical protein LTR27_003260 [Elasticomyces elasticus]
MMFSETTMNRVAEVAPLLISLIMVSMVLISKAIAVWGPAILRYITMLKSTMVTLLQMLMGAAWSIRLANLTLSAFDVLCSPGPSILGRLYLAGSYATSLVSSLLMTIIAMYIIDLAAADEVADLLDGIERMRPHCLPHLWKTGEAMKLTASSPSTTDKSKIAGEHTVTEVKDQGDAPDATDPGTEGDDTLVNDTAEQGDFHELTRSDFEGWAKPQ